MRVRAFRTWAALMLPLLLISALQPSAYLLPLARTSLEVQHSRLLRPRASRLRASEGSSPSFEDDIERELRKALSEVPNSEQQESDKRVIDGLLEDRKGDLSAVEGQLARNLEGVQEAIDEKLSSAMAGLQQDFDSKLEDSIGQLQRPPAQDESVDRVPLKADGSISASLGPDAQVVIVGAGTPLGTQLLSSLADGTEWKLRGLVPEGFKAPAAPAGIEIATFAPFAPSALKKTIADADALVILSEGAGGAGGVEPPAMDRLMQAVSDKTRRLVFVSSHGVERTAQLPFSMQNMFGALDKQRAAEQEALLRAKRGLASFSVVRVGKLKADGGASGPASVEIAPGDQISGDVGVSAAAVSLLQTLSRDEAINATFGIAAAPAAAPGTVAGSAAAWDDQFLKLIGPELWRRPVKLKADAVVTWLREWALGFLKPGRGLTTPVQVVKIPDGVLLRFLSSGSGYADFDEEETTDAKWEQAAARSAAEARGSQGKPDGALRILAEAEPSPRVRVCRAEMEEGIVIKEMSEAAVLERLEKDLKNLEATASR